MRTVHLTERQSTITQLSSKEIAFLLREHAYHLSIVPTYRRHRYRLTPTRLIGTIQGQTTCFVIHPKVPVETLLFFLDDQMSHGNADPSESVLDFFISRLLELWQQRVRAGLAQGYVERHEQSNTLQGRLDVPAQMRDVARAQPQIHSQVEERSIDVPCNQIPLATMNYLLKNASLSDSIQENMQTVLQLYSAISTVPLDPNLFSVAQQHPAWSSYRPLFNLCRWLTEGLDADSLLLDLERLFERYIERSLLPQMEASSFTLVSQPWTQLAPGIQARPDVLIRSSSCLEMVLDVKWKRLSKRGPKTEDLYQMISYCAALGAKHGVLIYPGSRDRCQNYRLSHSPIEIQTRTVQVAGPLEECQRSIHQLGEQLCEILRQ